MEYPKQMKDLMYNLLQQPTLENFREFIRGQTGEHNPIDFKQEWIEKDKLAKIMLALANYGGGVVVFGVHENDDKSFICKGLPEFMGKEKVESWIKKYVSPNLKYEIYDFDYQASEYAELIGKKFQLLVIEDTPEFLPFISRKEGENIKAATIYIRRGTSDEIVCEEELGKILDRRMKDIYPITGQPLDLKEHLSQLKELYEHISPSVSKMTDASRLTLLEVFKPLTSITSSIWPKYETEKNPLYPDESYEEFI